MKKNILNKVSIIFFFMSILICSFNSFGEENTMRKEFFLKGLEYNLSHLKTAEVNYSVKIVDTSGKKVYTKEIIWKYKPANGKEYMKIVIHDELNGRIANIIEVSLNHKENTGIEIRRQRELMDFTGKAAEGKILNEINVRRFPNTGLPYNLPPSSFFSILWPENVSIKEILTDPHTEILTKKEYIGDDECYIIYAPKLSSRQSSWSYKIWVSPEKGYLPRKIQIINPQNQKVYFDFIITLAKFGQNLWFPTKVIHHAYLLAPGKEYVTEYKGIKINQEIDDKVFDITFPPGTEVYDERMDISFTVPEK